MPEESRGKKQVPTHPGQCHSDKDDGKRTGTEIGSGLFFLLRKLQKRVDRTGKMCGRFRY